MKTKFSIILFSFTTALYTFSVHAGNHFPMAIVDQDYYPEASNEKITLGKFLFFDKVLSGNRNTSCATCHHTLTATGDGLALPVGEGGRGLGITRDTGSGSSSIHERVPRNAPTVFNLGAKEFAIMFHDGRAFPDDSFASGFSSPAGNLLPVGLDNPLAVQAMFPVTSATEMAGQGDENEISLAAAENQLAGENGVWNLLAQRLRSIPEYVTLFREAFSHINSAEDISFVDAANAISAFEASAWRADNSAFDKFLRGNKTALSRQQKEGKKLFYGEAGCSSCHSGKFQTDQSFHAIAMPQVGPGKGHNSNGYFDGREDFGREAVTGDPADRFKFRTPSLRNVALTYPYGHAGAYNSLEAVVHHHLDPVNSLNHYDASQIALPSRSDLDALDLLVMNDPTRVQEIANRNELASTNLNDYEFKALMSFLHALTDLSSIDLRNDTPKRVPSGLSLAE